MKESIHLCILIHKNTKQFPNTIIHIPQTEEEEFIIRTLKGKVVMAYKHSENTHLISAVAMMSEHWNTVSHDLMMTLTMMVKIMIVMLVIWTQNPVRNLRNTDKWSIQKEHNYGANRSIIPTESK
jgi:hypothetical protein